ncbi:MAG: pseudaminic acid cytidylyltransferase [Ginsengibacter sp.]
MENKAIAIIAARGGSKRIPKKNIRSFLGRPIISYSIDAAINSGLFGEIMVSTDSEEIAGIAMRAGAKVPFLRSEVNSNDFAGTADVIAEVINYYKMQGVFYEKGCCIYPTAVFVTPDLLKKAYDILIDKKFDVVFPATRFSYPIQRSLRVLPGSKAEMLWPENYYKRSQDLEKVYHDAGQFYWFVSNYILQSNKLFSDNTGVIEISELIAQDIDNEEDWKLAEIKHSFCQK